MYLLVIGHCMLYRWCTWWWWHFFEGDCTGTTLDYDWPIAWCSSPLPNLNWQSITLLAFFFISWQSKGTRRQCTWQSDAAHNCQLFNNKRRQHSATEIWKKVATPGTTSTCKCISCLIILFPNWCVAYCCCFFFLSFFRVWPSCSIDRGPVVKWKKVPFNRFLAFHAAGTDVDVVC